MSGRFAASQSNRAASSFGAGDGIRKLLNRSIDGERQARDLIAEPLSG